MTSPSELWRPCLRFAGYEVSNLGRVRSLDRVVTYQRRDGRPPIERKRKGKILKQSFIGAGYLMVSIAGRPRYVHILVLEAFQGPRPNGLMGLHRDDDTRNCRLDNLRWGTAAENAEDAKANGIVIGRPIGSKDRVQRVRRQHA